MMIKNSQVSLKQCSVITEEKLVIGWRGSCWWPLWGLQTIAGIRNKKRLNEVWLGASHLVVGTQRNASRPLAVEVQTGDFHSTTAAWWDLAPLPPREFIARMDLRPSTSCPVRFRSAALPTAWEPVQHGSCVNGITQFLKYRKPAKYLYFIYVIMD